MENEHEDGYMEIYEPAWSGSLTTAARELARYELDLVAVQEFRWRKGGTVSEGLYFFL